MVAATWLDEGETGAGTLLWVAHHLVVDGVSWRVLVDDLQRAYQDPEAALPQGPVSYTHLDVYKRQNRRCSVATATCRRRRADATPIGRRRIRKSR